MKELNQESKELLNHITNKNYGKKFFLLIIGTLLGALTFNIFYKPYDVIPTGSTGLAVLINEYTNIDQSIMIFIVNFILMLIALISYKQKYASKYLLITIIYPIFVKSTTVITNQIDLENCSLFLIMIFGGVLSGLSSGIIRMSGYTPGGFSVLFDLMHDKLHLGVGSSSIIINLITISLSGVIFGLDKALYAIIAMIAASYITDKVIIGISNNKVFYIVSKHPNEIRDCIIDKFHYSTTIIKTKNGLSSKKMLMTVVPTIEYLALKEVVTKLDPDAFFLIVDTFESSVKKNCKNM